ncbi:MAG: formylglycine-generating enzyme family protein [Bacteroidia bacterium]|nr:formylglycine-generating enzyme family protein [Bacteroidia bacterium]
MRNLLKVTQQNPNPMPATYTETLATGLCLEMIYIQGGSFLMGGEERDNEKPIHKVHLSDFTWLSTPLPRRSGKR